MSVIVTDGVLLNLKNGMSTMSIEMECKRYKVTLDGIEIGCFCSEESLLEGFENRQINIPSLCRKGTCGCCKMLLLKGKVKQENQSALTDEEMEESIILACRSYPREDIEVEIY